MQEIPFRLFSLRRYGKHGRFSGRLRPDWRNTAQAAMARLGSIYNRVKDRVGRSARVLARTHKNAHISLNI